MNAHSLELSDPDRDGFTLHHDAAGVWVTCTSEANEVTVGPLPLDALREWILAPRSV